MTCWSIRLRSPLRLRRHDWLSGTLGTVLGHPGAKASTARNEREMMERRMVGKDGDGQSSEPGGASAKRTGTRPRCLGIRLGLFRCLERIAPPADADFGRQENRPPMSLESVVVAPGAIGGCSCGLGGKGCRMEITVGRRSGMGTNEGTFGTSNGLGSYGVTRRMSLQESANAACKIFSAFPAPIELKKVHERLTTGLRCLHVTDMHVSLCTGQTGVPQCYLHHGQICISRNQMTGKTVLQDVNESLCLGEPGGFGVLTKDAIDLLACKMPALPGNKQSPRTIIGPDLKPRGKSLGFVKQGLSGVPHDGLSSLERALDAGDGQLPVLDVVQLQCGGFRCSQAVSIDRKQECPVSGTVFLRGFQDLQEFIRGERLSFRAGHVF